MSWNSWMLNFALLSEGFLQRFSFSWTFAASRWWSDAASAPLFTRTSRRERLNYLFMHMWSIWFSVVWSGDIQVALWMDLWGKTVPPMTRLLSAHVSANLSPFSFMMPSPCFPITSSYPLLLFPTLGNNNSGCE